MFSQTVHTQDSSMGTYYKSLQMDSQDTLYFSNQQLVQSDQQPPQPPQSSQSPSLPTNPHQSPTTKLLLQFFFGRTLFIQKVLNDSKSNSSEWNKYLKEKIILFVCACVCLIALLVALWFGVGHFLVGVLVLGCVGLYFNEMREEKLREVLSGCGEIAAEWSSAYRKLMKYIKQIEVVYAQINLNNDNDFRDLLNPANPSEPIEKKLLRPRIACLEIRRLLVCEIRKLQEHMIDFVKESAQSHADLQPKSNLPQLATHHPHPNNYYTLADIKTLHSTLSLLKYDVKQIIAFLILSPSIPSFVAYQTLQDYKEMREMERQSARIMLAMLESYQNYYSGEGSVKIDGEKRESNGKKEVVKYCKERTHLLNVYYNEFVETGDERLVGQALTEIKGIALCLEGLMNGRRGQERGVQVEKQEMMELGDSEENIKNEENRVVQKRMFYLNDDGERVLIESPDSEQVIETLENLLRNKDGKKEKEAQKQPDERIKFGFLGQLKSMFGESQQHVFE